MAGRGGLNLTHAEPLETFLTRYSDTADIIRDAVRAFPPQHLIAWANGLGTQTFVGSSGRVFPTAMKASPLLRAWLRRLDSLGVTVRWRHRWTIGPRTNFITEYYKVGDERRKMQPDRNLLKDYFYREYEQDSQPLSYALLHHSFNFSSLDIYVQQRTNRWYDQLEKLPEQK